MLSDTTQRLNNRLNEHFIAHHDLMNIWLFVLVETETDHVAHLEVVVVKVFGQLLFASLVVRLSAPYLVVMYELRFIHLSLAENR